MEFLFALVVSFVTTLSFFILLYGWEDMYFILVKHISSSSWSVREHLFDGSNATLSKMSYVQAIPLLFRFLLMYVAQYWFILISCIAAFFLARKIKSSASSILFNPSVIYALTLPPCLSALAHFGGVENSLLFANATGIMLLIFGIAHIISNQLSPNQVPLICLGNSSFDVNAIRSLCQERACKYRGQSVQPKLQIFAKWQKTSISVGIPLPMHSTLRDSNFDRSPHLDRLYPAR